MNSFFSPAVALFVGTQLIEVNVNLVNHQTRKQRAPAAHKIAERKFNESVVVTAI